MKHISKFMNPSAASEEGNSQRGPTIPDDNPVKLRELALSKVLENPPHKLLDVCIAMYLQARDLSQNSQTITLTPQHLLDLFTTYRALLHERLKTIEHT